MSKQHAAEKQERIRAAREHYELRKIGRRKQTFAGIDPVTGWARWTVLAFVLALLSSWMALPVAAQTPAPTPARLHYGILSGTETLVGLSKGASRHVIVFARAQADYQAFGPCHAAGRVEGSALGDGGAGGVNLEDPNSFTTLEIYGVGYCEALSGFSVGGIFGEVVDIEKGLPVATTAPKTYGVGVILGKPYAAKWLLVKYGKHQAAGDGNRWLFALEYPLAKNLSAIADGAIRWPVPKPAGGVEDRSFIRAGLAIHAGKQ